MHAVGAEVAPAGSRAARSWRAPAGRARGPAARARRSAARRARACGGCAPAVRCSRTWRACSRRLSTSPCGRVRLRQPLPGVDPVQDPARGDLAGVVVGRHLEDEARDEPLPRLQVAPVARRAEGIRQVEAVVELDPVDPPLLVVGQLGACSQSGSRPSSRVSPAKVKTPAATVVGERAVAVLVLVDAEDGTRAHGGQRSQRTASRNSAARSSRQRARRRSARVTVARPFSVRRSRQLAVVVQRGSSASASACGSSGSTAGR